MAPINYIGKDSLSLSSRVSTVNLVLISPVQPTGHPEVTYKTYGLYSPNLWAISYNGAVRMKPNMWVAE